MSRRKRARPRPLKGTVTLPLREFEEMRRLSKAAVEAYNVLNIERPSLPEITEATWIIFRALEGGMPREIQ